ncbi:hypothetical protein RQP46_005266 [Phenoliferia psychrophenolica]
MTDSIIERIQAVSSHENCCALVEELLGALSADAASLSAGTDIDRSVPTLERLSPTPRQLGLPPEYSDADAIKASFILNDLVEDCPFEAMRFAALGLLHDFLVNKIQAALRPSIFLSSLLLIELGSSFLQHTPTSLFSSPPPLEDLLESHAYRISRKLSLASFLISRDTINLTEIQNKSKSKTVALQI